MAAPERLNVLLSRARKALVLNGNAKTFQASRKGGQIWSSLLKLLGRQDCVFDGLPVRCEQHPDQEMLLQIPSDFDELCPDGGCSAAW